MSYYGGNYRYDANDYVGPGYVTVFDWNGATNGWEQRGGSITASGADEFDEFGSMLAMSVDGNRIAVGASKATTFGTSGHAYFVVYDWNGAADAWENLTRFDADRDLKRSATSIAMNDHGTLIVAATIGESAYPEANASLVAATLGSSGQIAGLGDEIALVQSGAYALAMSADGRIVAHGAPGHDWLHGQGNGTVAVHRWNVATSAWGGMGSVLAGNSAFDGFGESVALSASGTVLAVGAATSRPTGQGEVHPAGGYVHVFEFDAGANDWVRRGAQLTGEDGSHGRSVALSADGNVLAIGEYNHGPPEHYGRVRVYSWDYAIDHEWKLVDTIDGEFEMEEFGWSLALSDDGAILVVGARRGEQVGLGVYQDIPESPNQAKGHVRVCAGGAPARAARVARAARAARDVALLPRGLRLLLAGRHEDGR